MICNFIKCLKFGQYKRQWVSNNLVLLVVKYVSNAEITATESYPYDKLISKYTLFNDIPL